MKKERKEPFAHCEMMAQKKRKKGAIVMMTIKCRAFSLQNQD